MDRFDVSAFYRFAPLPGYQAMQAPLQGLCDRHGIKGILLIAPEGINGTVAGLPEDMAIVMEDIGRITGLTRLEPRTSHAAAMPFLRMKVRLKREIVTMGEAVADPLAQVGTYVAPEDWNALVSDPDVLLIDTRNSFEHAVGTFAGAIDPGTTSFGEFPDFVRDTLAQSRHRKVALFCTGGIRCEKASSFLLAEGFAEVYHLKGGILGYLETIRPEDSLWQGGCFVFDRRVALGHGLAVEPVRLCLTCSAVIDGGGLQSPDYEEGVSCRACAPGLSEQQKASARARQHQIRLAEAKGQRHLGPARGESGE